MGSNGLIFLALLPGILIIIYIYRMDKVESEPWSLILKLVIFGMASCAPAVFMETFVDEVMPDYPEGSLPYALSTAFVSAALCEEICKYVLLKLGSWNNRCFGYRFDGIVYGVAVAVGFAVLENILYVIQGGFYVALMRGVMAVPLHAFCGLFMGVFYGAAKKAQIDGRGTFKYKAAALMIPIMIHGIYDTLAFLGNTFATIVLLIFVGIMYMISINVVKAYSQDDASSAFSPEGRFEQEDIRLSRDMIVISCPYCHGRLRVPSGLGRIRITCPHCSSEFNEIT